MGGQHDAYLREFQLANAIETVAAAGYKRELPKILNYSDCIDKSLYDNTILRKLKSS